MECNEDEATQIDTDEAGMATLAPADTLAGGPAAPAHSALAAGEEHQASPAKHRTLEVGAGLEVAQSPSGRTRGTWSPSASPSSSILKKAQKRALEEDAPISPLVKVTATLRYAPRPSLVSHWSFIIIIHSAFLNTQGRLTE